MEAIRINTILDEANFPWEKIKQYYGKKAEIIILVESNEESQTQSLAGSLKKYASPNKRKQENGFLGEAFKSKYDNNWCQLYSDKNLDYADAFLVAQNHLRNFEIHSFDKKIIKLLN